MKIPRVIGQLMGKLKGMTAPAAKEPLVDRDVLVRKIRDCELFKDLPQKNVDEILARMETARVESGETIIKQGDEGDYYYLLAQGSGRVFRSGPGDAEPRLVAELLEPVGFGEEALISNAKRNATVVMTSPGIVMRLSKENFNTYIKDPLVTWFAPVDAQWRIAEGAKWLDVRETLEAGGTRLHGAACIPMRDLRERMADLDNDALYICYCENGRMSSTAAFLLSQRGFKAGVLRGGIRGLQRAVGT